MRSMPVLLPGSFGSDPLLVHLTDRALTVAIGFTMVVSWDRAGRLYSLWERGRTWRRGLSGRGLEKWHDASGRHRRPMNEAAVSRLVDRAGDRARTVATLVESSAGQRARADCPGLTQVLSRAALFDSVAAAADARRFSTIYGEIGVLPPDQYLAFVAQATEGCTFNSCTFCRCYRRPFRVRSAAEFAAHVREARAFAGDSLLLRGRSVFLGAANALALPTSRLLPILDSVADAFGGRPPAVCGFVDGFSGARKTTDDYRALRERGLRRAYVGLESGSDRLLALVRKPATSGETVLAVRAMKEAGLETGVIVMIGLGGRRFDQEHAAATAATLERMGLDSRDLVYFSELVESADVEDESATAGEPLSAEERRMQRLRISEGFVSAGSQPRTAVYDLRELLY
jgi:radical SAM superfamily enzyme YgiQ (UPF0313 family)